MKKILISASISVVLATGFSACGGSSSSGGSDSASADSDTQTGYFIDAPVEGLTYTTATQSGTTGSDGSYKYKEGETVTFKIGEVEIGSAKASTIPLTPVSIANSDMSKASKIAYLLQKH